ncbi:MAG: LamG-like jellyroll fold domain-containing protein [Verrucomicrobiota bacterium]
MKSKRISYLASLGLALCLVQSALAWPDFQWTGLGGDGMWNNPLNWTNLDLNTTGLPEDDVSGANVQIDPANGSSVITIPAGYVVDLDFENPTAYYNTIYGPEQGATLDIYGTLEYAWAIAPYSPNPAVRSYINMYTNSFLMNSNGGAILIGDAWWPGPQFGNHTTMNMYANASSASLGGGGCWLGGHLNIYDTATFVVDGYFNMSTAFGESDGTRSIVLGGGVLALPEGTIDDVAPGANSGSITNWIQRGILRAYGKGFDTNDLNISDNGANTIVAPVPLGGALQRVYFQPLLQTKVNVGVFQQATLVGDYPAVGGVLLSSSEPGLSLSSFPHPVYASSNPNIATIDTNGLVAAVGVGTATLTATVGAFTSTNSLAITVAPVIPGLAHRYSFTTDASDAIGGANGTLNGDATISAGQLVLSGNVGSSVTLPAGILSGVNVVTIETWATFPSTINPYANLFAFGYADTTPLDPNVNLGGNYITLSPHTGVLTTQANFGQGLPGNDGEWDAVASQVLDNQTNVHLVAVFNPYAGSISVYVNASLIASAAMFNNMIDPVAYQGPTYTNSSILSYTLGADLNNYIGQSLYAADPGLLANIDEFRIYTNALTAAQIAADHALGPNQLIGSSTTVSLSASVSDGNLIIQWPTTSGLVALMASPKLGPGAVWTPVNGALTAVGGSYRMTLPTTAAAQYFRLQQ